MKKTMARAQDKEAVIRAAAEDHPRRQRATMGRSRRIR